jgi:hypothetical protein
MKKLFLAAIASLAISTCALAQGPGAKISVGPEIGLPLGDASDAYSLTVGGTVKLEVPVSGSDFNVTFTSGYVSYLGKSLNYSYYTGYSGYGGSIKVPNSGFIPVKIGGKYYANQNVYLEGEVGLVTNVSNSDGGNAFVYAPGIGVSLPISKSKNAFDLGFRYEGWSKDGSVINQLALRLAYKFGL